MTRCTLSAGGLFCCDCWAFGTFCANVQMPPLESRRDCCARQHARWRRWNDPPVGLMRDSLRLHSLLPQSAHETWHSCESVIATILHYGLSDVNASRFA